MKGVVLRRVLRGARISVVIIVSMFALIVLVVYVQARRAWPQTSGTVTVKPLVGGAEVRRDSYGVPHIFASNERDAFFAQGFVHAQDRLWQMYLGRALGRGELAGLFGEGALEGDRVTRTFGLVAAAEKDLTLLDPDTRESVLAYCDGVNAFLAAGSALPIEFTVVGVKPQAWQPLDVLLVVELMALSMSQNAYFELMRTRLSTKLGEDRMRELMAPYPEDAPTIVAPGPSRHGAIGPEHRGVLPPALSVFRGMPGGSNAWVVHGSRTVTGKPLLANDMHLSLSLPSIWYENGLYAGRYSVVGVSLPGVPFVVAGHNSNVAWGVTNMNSDVQDLYVEKLDDRDKATRYEVDGAWSPLSISVEKIPVKGKEPSELRIFRTRHGPLVNDVLPGGKEIPPVALRWAAREGSTSLNALAALDRAKGSDDLRNALRAWDSPSLNFVYADTEGNIGYQGTGRIPVRVARHAGTTPVDGSTHAFDWQGFIPFDELPFERNPKAGFVASANNKVAPEGYEHFLAFDWADPYRASRITEVLEANSHVSMEDMRGLQADTFSLPAKALVPFLLAANPSTDLERKALDLVRPWNLRFEVESVAASIYYVWYFNLLDAIVADELGEPMANEFKVLAMLHTPMFARLLASGESSWFDDVRTPERETRDIIVKRALSSALEWLTAHYGKDPEGWRWGELHAMTFAHQPFGQSGIAPVEWLFNSRKVPTSGEPYSVNATFMDPARPYATDSGPSQRFIADLAALGRSVSSTPIGQSGLLFHPHREDQVGLWQRVDHHPMLFEREQVIRGEKDVLLLQPSP